MDFALLSPEINSGRLYAGPGSGSMVAAAEAWDKIAAELYAAANNYKSVISGLTSGPWQGPSAASMAAAAASNVSWLSSTAAQAEEAASKARAAVTAYEEAYTSVVPPPVITANRTQVSQLLATNVFGQNTSAIATLEAQYAEMWAADAAAMYSYASSSAAATNMSPFIPPQPSTNESGQANQSAAMAQAAGAPAGNAQSAVSSIQQSFSAVPNALQSLATAAPAAAAPAQAADPLSTLSNLISVFFDLPADLATFGVDIPLGTLGIVALPLDIIGAGTGLHTDDIVSGWNGQESFPGYRAGTGETFPGDAVEPAAGHGAAAQPVGRLGRGEYGGRFIGAADVDHLHSGGTPRCLHIAGSVAGIHGTCRRGRRRRRGVDTRVKPNTGRDGAGRNGRARDGRHGHRRREIGRQSSRARSGEG